jgi:hypothetical protein
MTATVKERPILFTGPMVRAILEGRKTQTRRPVKWTPVHGFNLAFYGLSPGHYMTGVESSPWVLYSRRGDGVWEQRTEPLRCPYGAPEDRLWVRETHARGTMNGGELRWVRFRATEPNALPPGARWTPAIHMPRWASRLLLEVTEFRVERLDAITEEDARAEGMEGVREGGDRDLRYTFRRRWAAMYGGGPFDGVLNPWVWAVSFRGVDAARSAA